MSTANGVAGKVVVITGASSGIGEATARMLAGQGARLVVGARRVERLATLVDELRDTDAELKRSMEEWRSRAIPADAIARAIRFAIEQPDIVDVSEIIVRPTNEK